MCKWGTQRTVTIRQVITVDACIADQIVWLNEVGVKTTGCCCAHGDGDPTATIQPSTMDRARWLGYTVNPPTDAGYPTIVLKRGWEWCAACKGNGGGGISFDEATGEMISNQCDACEGRGYLERLAKIGGEG